MWLIDFPAFIGIGGGCFGVLYLAIPLEGSKVDILRVDEAAPTPLNSLK